MSNENFYPGELLPDDEIRVTLLGTGTPFPRRGQACASVFVEAGPDKFLLDCGSGAPQNFTSLEIPLRTSTRFSQHITMSIISVELTIFGSAAGHTDAPPR